MPPDGTTCTPCTHSQVAEDCVTNQKQNHREPSNNRLPLFHHLVHLVEVDGTTEHACLLTLRALGLIRGVGQQLHRIPKAGCHASASQGTDLAQLMATLQPKGTVQNVLQNSISQGEEKEEQQSKHLKPAKCSRVAWSGPGFEFQPFASGFLGCCDPKTLQCVALSNRHKARGMLPGAIMLTCCIFLYQICQLHSSRLGTHSKQKPEKLATLLLHALL